MENVVLQYMNVQKYSCKQCYAPIVLTTSFYNIIFKIKSKLYTASESANGKILSAYLATTNYSYCCLCCLGYGGFGMEDFNKFRV